MNNTTITKTSHTHPLQIDSILLESGGMIGMTFCPGKKYPDGFTEYWNRDLEMDLSVIVQWGTKVLITLLEDQEFVELQVPQLPALTRKLGLEWFHLPIKDGSTPKDTFEQQWADIGKNIHQLLDRGNKIVLHCKGGMGRTGLVAAKILIERGCTPENAIHKVRAARPGAIDTGEQFVYLLNMRHKS